MTYPALPFANHTWRISHHQGILTPKVLNALLFAASTYQDSRDPTQEINNYLVTNEIVPPNIRGDSQQADIWRDYQQLLPELGLIPSTRSVSHIQLSPAGLSFLDGGIDFTEFMTVQAFRWQYPNGHNTQRSAGDPSQLNFAAQQAAAGILIKPAVLLWQVLDGLRAAGELLGLSAPEIEYFVIPASTHDEVDLVVEAIRQNRTLRLAFPSGQTKQRRNASDWMKRLDQTYAFMLDADDRLNLSVHSIANLSKFRELIHQLCEPRSFWIYPTDGSQAASWGLWYGTFDSNGYPIPVGAAAGDFGSEPEPEEEILEAPREIAIRAFEWRAEAEMEQRGATISSVYSADLSNSSHRLHDSMIRLIADCCRRKRINVFSDPATLDLLIELENQELLIEVKSATSKNLAHKIRMALGQVTYYGFLRSKQSPKPRRLGIALTLGVDETHWSKDFLTDYLDVDYVTLREGKLLTYSRSAEVAALIA
ncbi:hypothetical protein [Edaphobacter sp.]|uniref:hypothetical protein n=1 Tax=Edaphobacter sp. TaxID=1934404 RepID=UPI002DBEFE1B|nr:hypothetical protein [Edaphobacter sp.]HEU5339650.1 hypothetical protein [Edaphobacter sp.]